MVAVPGSGPPSTSWGPAWGALWFAPWLSQSMRPARSRAACAVWWGSPPSASQPPPPPAPLDVALWLVDVPVEAWVAVDDPVAYFGAALRQALAETGIEVAGGIRTSRQLPVGAWTRVALHRSDLMSALEVVNKRSQNFYAESVLKLLGARTCGQGSWEAGVRSVTEFLTGVGLAPGSYQLADGSGMSRNNRFSPRQITTLLRRMFE